MIGYINLTRHPLHTSSKYLPVTYQTLLETYPRQPADTLRSFSRHPPDTQETPYKYSPDNLKIPPIHPVHLCVQKRRAAGGWVAGGFMTIMPRCGSILQAGTCQILSLAEYPRWSRVWQYTYQLDFFNFLGTQEEQGTNKYIYSGLPIRGCHHYFFSKNFIGTSLFWCLFVYIIQRKI